jgi:hypothetical protein
MKFDAQTTTSDVHSAMELWQAFEYLSPQPAPAPKRASRVCVWSISCDCQGDAEMPWVSTAKQHDLATLFKVAPEKRHFVLHAGILPGRIYTNAAREILGVAAIDDEEARKPSDAASLVLPIDSYGYVAGRPFISSTPWALGSLAKARKHSKRFNFRGFFGEQGAEKRVIKELQELLVKWTLVPEPSEEDKGPSTVGELLQKAQLATKAECQAKRLTEEETNAELERVKAKIRTNYRTVRAEDIQALTETVFSLLGWAPSEEGPWIMETKYASKKEPDDPLNSFYAEDIEKVESAIIDGKFGATLKQFLSNQESPGRVDLDKDKETLIAGVHPSRLPLAAWPGTFPLVTAQQFAVNTIHSELVVEGIYSVNGPPGTGKTTMLKDIVASVVQQRADKLVKFSRPEDAFKSRLDIEDYQYSVWQLDKSLRGFGIVVSSANNGAVENISRELPGLNTIDKSIELDYFSQVSDSLTLNKGENRPTVQQTWGLISGALGNSTNRSMFANNFWWGDKESKKLRDGSPNPLAPVSIQEWIAENGHTVPSWQQAKERYQHARARVVKAIACASDLADKLQKRTELQNEFDQLQHRAVTLRQEVADAEAHLREAQKKLSVANAAHRRIQTQHQLAQSLHRTTNALQQVQTEQVANLNHECAKDSALVLDQRIEDAKVAETNAQTNFNNHVCTRPSLLSRFLFRSAAREWDKKNVELQAVIAQAQIAVQMAQVSKNNHLQWLAQQTKLAAKHSEAETSMNAARNSLVSAGFDPSFPLYMVEESLKRSGEIKNTIEAQAYDAEVLALRGQTDLRGVVSRQQEVSTVLITLERELAQNNLLDNSRSAWNLRKLNRDEFHMASPYQDGGELFSARRDLFVAAMALHQSFIVESWKKLKPALAAFTSYLQGQISASKIEGGAMGLWDAFFLTVPLISTTFASIPRLFKGIKAEELAWVLIDEAGQATPQQALGAIWRSKRAVIVGDPIQLEPVVSIPKELIEPLKLYCGTPDHYVPPSASAQTIADRSNRYGTLMGQDDPDTAIWLGSPLMVHRRCLNPMFNIANAIAYEDKMVYGTGDDPEFHAPPSQWIDANNNHAQGHWIASQGHIVLELIRKLTNNKVAVNGKFRLYVITPFKLVAENMQIMLAPVVGKAEAAKMCGTVHTFQGKEADFVIFLLGGDPSKPTVISGYAGLKPNLVNVAVTRAKKRLYVVGNRKYWTGSNDSRGYYKTMNKLLANIS